MAQNKTRPSTMLFSPDKFFFECTKLCPSIYNIYLPNYLIASVILESIYP